MNSKIKTTKGLKLRGGFFQFFHDVEGKWYSLKSESYSIPNDKIDKILEIINKE